jgi:NADH-quinone oxidoreductase subunit J
MGFLFFLFAIVALAGAVGVVVLRNPFYCVLALVVHLIALALLFLLLEAQFVAVAQIIVYAGAVMVLYVFVVAYVGGGDKPAPLWRATARQRALAIVFGIAVFVELMIAVLGTSLKALDTQGPHVTVGYGSPGEIGALLLERFLLPFELASFLLLVAAVGAVALAGRRGGIPEDEILAPERTVDPSHGLSPSPMPASAGSMAEGVAGYGVTQPLPEPSEEVLRS